MGRVYSPALVSKRAGCERRASLPVSFSPFWRRANKGTSVASLSRREGRECEALGGAAETRARRDWLCPGQGTPIQFHLGRAGQPIIHLHHRTFSISPPTRTPRHTLTPDRSDVFFCRAGSPSRPRHRDDYSTRNSLPLSIPVRQQARPALVIRSRL